VIDSRGRVIQKGGEGIKGGGLEEKHPQQLIEAEKEEKEKKLIASPLWRLNTASSWPACRNIPKTML